MTLLCHANLRAGRAPGARAQSRLPIEIAGPKTVVITYLYATPDPRFSTDSGSTNVGAGCSCHSASTNIIARIAFLPILSDQRPVARFSALIRVDECIGETKDSDERQFSHSLD